MYVRFQVRIEFNNNNFMFLQERDEDNVLIANAIKIERNLQ